MANGTIETTCCIVGGGPAGIMLGYLLARKGAAVTVLEKHRDFNRDFRGDTVHPSTLTVLHELGLLQDFLRMPHQELTTVGGRFGDYAFTAADFRHVTAFCKFVALMPQWDFLSFLSEHARKFPSFDLRMEHEAVGLVRNGGQVVGVDVRTPDGPMQVHCDLVVGCDGRHSAMRKAERMEVVEFGVPIDVLWFHISRHEGDPDQLLGNINYGQVLVLINRGDYYQAGLLIRKGSFEKVKEEGLGSFRERIGRIAPYLRDRLDELRDWDEVKLLSVRLNRLRQWHSAGLLFIGDAAHAMSPAGGVGINLAIQDAVATANLLGDALRARRVGEELLAQVQRRRELPTRVTQTLQANVHKVFDRIFQNSGAVKAPWQLKAAVKIPGARFLLAELVGVGIRPEHVSGVQEPVRHGGKPLVKIAVALGVALGASILWFRRTREQRVERNYESDSVPRERMAA